MVHEVRKSALIFSQIFFHVDIFLNKCYFYFQKISYCTIFGEHIMKTSRNCREEINEQQEINKQAEETTKPCNMFYKLFKSLKEHSFNQNCHPVPTPTFFPLILMECTDPDKNQKANQEIVEKCEQNEIEKNLQISSPQNKF